MIPIVSLFGVVLLSTAYRFINPQAFLGMETIFSQSITNFKSYAPIHIIVAISLLAAVFIWALIYRVGRYATTPKKDKSNYLLSLIVWLVALVMILFSSEKSTAEFLLVFPSAAIIMAGFMEQTNEKWFKEIIMWLCLLLPLGLFFV